MNYLLGVDLGTQGTKAALFNDQGDSLAQGFVPSRLLRTKKGHVEENPEHQVDAVCQSIRKCLLDAAVDRKEIKGMAIAGQMAGVLGVDRKGYHVTPYDSWLDTRCADQVNFIEERAGEQVISLTGSAPSFNHGPKMLWWKVHRKSVYRQIQAFVQPAAYAAMRLCGIDGQQAFIDATYLHFTGFADNRQQQWSDPLCAELQFDRDKLPRIVDPHTIVGEVTREFAKRCGLQAGTPVAAGCGDTAASFLACGATRAGIAVDVSGTASVFAATTENFVVDRSSRTLSCGRSVVPGLWHPYAYINGGGLNIEWFRQVLGDSSWGAKEADFQQLESQLQSIQPSPDLPLFVPHFAGRVSPYQSSLRGAWANLNWSTDLAELYYAVLESVALEYGIYRQRVDDLAPHPPLTELRITGGGQHSEYWNRLKSDALGIPVRVILQPQGAPLGAAILAGQAVGLIQDLPAAAQQWAKAGKAIRPRPGRTRILKQRLDRYQRLLHQLKEV